MTYRSGDWPASPLMRNRIYNCDALELLEALPDESVDCVVTSPPYFGLRDYGVDGQIGLEDTPAQYIQRLVTIFHELKRVLKAGGNFWLNMGDTYTGGGRGNNPPNDSREWKQGTNSGSLNNHKTNLDNVPSKSLLLMPHRLAIALQDDGWICRQDNVWAKPNPMPESVTDRTTRAHEYVFHFVKSQRYYYNAGAIKEPVKEHSIKRQGRAVSETHKNLNGAPGQTPHSMFRARANQNKQDGLGKRTYAGFNERYEGQITPMANKRSVWTISPAQFRDAHFATFPAELVEICLLAGCPPKGLALDPFMGSGTTAFVARNLGMQYVGSELNPSYCKIIERRLRLPFQKVDTKAQLSLSDLPLFAEVSA